MTVTLRRCTGDRQARSIGRCSSTVQCRRQFHAHPWATALDAGEETGVEFTRGSGHQTNIDRDARVAQAHNACASNTIEGIADRHDDVCDPGTHQRIRARRRAAMMRTGFERDVGGGTTRRVSGFAQREHFRMRFASTFMKTATEHALSISDDATDARIRRRRVQAARGKT